MGVDVATYTVFGVKLPYDDDFTDAMYAGDAYREVEDFVVADGMSGEYIVIGKKLFDSEKSEEFQAIDIGTLPAAEGEVRQKFAEHFPTRLAMLDGPWQLMTFVHYS